MPAAYQCFAPHLGTNRLLDGSYLMYLSRNAIATIARRQAGICIVSAATNRTPGVTFYSMTTIPWFEMKPSAPNSRTSGSDER